MQDNISHVVHIQSVVSDNGWSQLLFMKQVFMQSIHLVHVCLRQGVEPAIIHETSIHVVNSFCSCLSQTRGGASYIHEISIHVVNSFCSCLSQTRGGASYIHEISIHAVNSFCSCLSQTRGGASYIHEISIHAVNSFCSCCLRQGVEPAIFIKEGGRLSM